jgi:hypothetical protein
LVKKILDLEFIEMTELLPDTWRLQEEDVGCCHQRQGQRKGPVTDILVWVECYASLVAVLASGHPKKMQEFMAYMRSIVKAHRTFTGEGWVSYDTCYHRKAAVSKSLDWDTIDFTLYNETFTGRAKAMACCRYCSSDLHLSQDCAYAPVSQHDSHGIQARARTSQSTAVCQL